MHLYLDVEGVLITPQPGSGPFGLARKEHLDEFIIWATANFNCYWLTGWAPSGHMNLLNDKLIPHLPPEAKKIKVSIWNDLKTEGLPYKNNDWIWIDDNLLKNEQKYLESIGCLRNFILVDPQEPSLRHVQSKIENLRRELEL